MIPGSITGIHPDDGCGFGDFKIMTTDSSHKLENEKLVLSNQDPSHWQFNIGVS